MDSMEGNGKSAIDASRQHIADLEALASSASKSLELARALEDAAKRSRKAAESHYNDLKRRLGEARECLKRTESEGMAVATVSVKQESDLATSYEAETDDENGNSNENIDNSSGEGVNSLPLKRKSKRLSSKSNEERRTAPVQEVIVENCGLAEANSAYKVFHDLKRGVYQYYKEGIWEGKVSRYLIHYYNQRGYGKGPRWILGVETYKASLLRLCYRSDLYYVETDDGEANQIPPEDGWKEYGLGNGSGGLPMLILSHNYHGYVSSTRSGEAAQTQQHELENEKEPTENADDTDDNTDNQTVAKRKKQTYEKETNNEQNMEDEGSAKNVIDASRQHIADLEALASSASKSLKFARLQDEAAQHNAEVAKRCREASESHYNDLKKKLDEAKKSLKNAESVGAEAVGIIAVKQEADSQLATSYEAETEDESENCCTKEKSSEEEVNDLKRKLPENAVAGAEATSIVAVKREAKLTFEAETDDEQHYPKEYSSGEDSMTGKCKRGEKRKAPYAAGRGSNVANESKSQLEEMDGVAGPVEEIVVEGCGVVEANGIYNVSDEMYYSKEGKWEGKSARYVFYYRLQPGLEVTHWTMEVEVSNGRTNDRIYRHHAELYYVKTDGIDFEVTQVPPVDGWKECGLGIGQGGVPKLTLVTSRGEMAEEEKQVMRKQACNERENHHSNNSDAAESENSSDEDNTNNDAAVESESSSEDDDTNNNSARESGSFPEEDSGSSSEDKIARKLPPPKMISNRLRRRGRRSLHC